MNGLIKIWSSLNGKRIVPVNVKLELVLVLPVFAGDFGKYSIRHCLGVGIFLLEVDSCFPLVLDGTSKVLIELCVDAAGQGELVLLDDLSADGLVLECLRVEVGRLLRSKGFS